MNTSTHPDCPFCRQNLLLKEAVITDTSQAYLIRSVSHPENHLIIPDAHAESPSQLPTNWWGNLAELIAHVPDLGPDYNISMNVGETAGQTVKHLHFWIIPRASGQPASGKGLAQLIRDINQTA